MDASVVVDILLDRGMLSERVSERIVRERGPLAAPHLVDVEVGHVLRRGVLRGELSAVMGQSALNDLLELQIERYAHTGLLRRAFELRDNATMYDAIYLALAEALGAPLLTRDAALAGIPGIDARIEVIGEPG